MLARFFLRQQKDPDTFTGMMLSKQTCFETLIKRAIPGVTACIAVSSFVSACQQRAVTDTPPNGSERPAQAEGPDVGSGKEKQSLWTIEDPNEWRDCLMSKMDAESGAEEASEKSESSQPPLVKNEAAPEWIFKPCPQKVEASASDKKELAHALVNLYDWRGLFLRESRESAVPIASPEVKIPDSVWSPDGLIAESSLDLPNNRLLSKLRARYKKADQVERLDLGFGLLTLVIDECILSGNSEDTARAWAFVDFYALHEECEYPYASYICGYLTRSKIADADRCKPYWIYEKDQHYKQYRKFILSLRALHE